MKKILVNFAHPAKSRSKINILLKKAIEDLEGVTVNDLYSKYPDFFIDIQKEQKLCQENDIILFQYPLYWFSVPSILKEWQDLVFAHGWAYGSNAISLKDKIFLQAISTGSEKNSYNKDGFNKFSIKELITPYQATAKLCKMTWLPPYCSYGVHRGLADEKLQLYVQEYKKLIIALRDEKLDIQKAKERNSINEDLDSLIIGEK